jgi:hypothetical protein
MGTTQPAVQRNRGARKTLAIEVDLEPTTKE